MTGDTLTLEIHYYEFCVNIFVFFIQFDRKKQNKTINTRIIAVETHLLILDIQKMQIKSPFHHLPAILVQPIIN